MSVIEATQDNFTDLLDQHPIMVLDFWADWCEPCKAFAPIFEQVSEQFSDVAFVKVNTEEQPDLASDFNIRSIPMIMVLRDNVVVFSQSGSMPASALSELIDQAKALDMDKVRENLQEDERGGEGEEG